MAHAMQSESVDGFWFNQDGEFLGCGITTLGLLQDKHLNDETVLILVVSRSELVPTIQKWDPLELVKVSRYLISKKVVLFLVNDTAPGLTSWIFRGEVACKVTAREAAWNLVKCSQMAKSSLKKMMEQDPDKKDTLEVKSSSDTVEAHAPKPESTDTTPPGTAEATSPSGTGPRPVDRVDPPSPDIPRGARPYWEDG